MTAGVIEITMAGKGDPGTSVIGVGSITTDKLADEAITEDKLSPSVLALIGEVPDVNLTTLVAKAGDTMTGLLSVPHLLVGANEAVSPMAFDLVQVGEPRPGWNSGYGFGHNDGRLAAFLYTTATAGGSVSLRGSAEAEPAAHGSGGIRGVHGDAWWYGDFDLNGDSVCGVYGDANQFGNGNIYLMQGVFGQVYLWETQGGVGGAGTADVVAAFDTYLGLYSTGKIDELFGLRVRSLDGNVAGSVGQAYGVYVGNMAVGNHDNPPYAIYTAGTVRSRFGGPVELAGGDPTAASHATSKSWVEAQIAASSPAGVAHLAGSETFTGLKTFEASDTNFRGVVVGGGKDAYSQFKFQVRNPAAPVPNKDLYAFGMETAYQDDGSFTYRDFYVFDYVTGRYLINIMANGRTSFGDTFSPLAHLDLRSLAATEPALLLRGFVAQTDSIFKIQNSAAVDLVTVNASGQVSGASPTSGSHFTTKTWVEAAIAGGGGGGGGAVAPLTLTAPPATDTPLTLLGAVAQTDPLLVLGTSIELSEGIGGSGGGRFLKIRSDDVNDYTAPIVEIDARLMTRSALTVKDLGNGSTPGLSLLTIYGSQQAQHAAQSLYVYGGAYTFINGYPYGLSGPLGTFRFISSTTTLPLVSIQQQATATGNYLNFLNSAEAIKAAITAAGGLMVSSPGVEFNAYSASDGASTAGTISLNTSLEFVFSRPVSLGQITSPSGGSAYKMVLGPASVELWGFSAQRLVVGTDNVTVLPGAAGSLIVQPNALATEVIQDWRSIGGTSLVSISLTGEPEVKTANKGVILKSANGTRYRLTVADDGALVTAAA